jgi:hypothetical protein
MWCVVVAVAGGVGTTTFLHDRDDGVEQEILLGKTMLHLPAHIIFSTYNTSSYPEIFIQRRIT